ncbi:MAG: hypothetical protein FD174_3896 [Geobacteraceae bacterium]|nr:MAG: hypothetical protein FD174_3896 [Geobacteraceae bacterium]
MPKDAILPIIIFLSSFASLAFEVALTRIFSVSLWYHFAFMIISIAMLGFAASGTVLSLYPRLKNPSLIGNFALLLGICITVSYLIANRIPFDPVRLAWERGQLLYIALYYVVLALPFFFTGMVIAAAFTAESGKAGLIYGADLIGAGLGSLGILAVMGVTAPERAVFLLSAIALAAASVSGGKRLKALSLVLILLDLALFFVQPEFAALRISPYKELQTSLKYPGAAHLRTYYTPFAVIDTFKSPAVRFAPGLSLRYPDQLPEQIGFTIDGGELGAITGTADKDALSFLASLPSSLPFALGNKTEVLVLDPRGGLQVLLAKYNGAAEVTKVEGNPALVSILRNEYREFAGDIYGDRTWTGLGRSWLMAGERKFGIIDISLMGSEPSGVFGIGEEYRYTVEAFREYLSHLQPEGVLSVNLYIIPPPRLDLRLLNTIVAALEERGIKEPARHVVAIRSWGSLCLLAKNSPFTAAEVEKVRQFAGERWFDPVHYPGIRPEETNRYVKMPSNAYFSAFNSILTPAARKAFVDGYIFDIKPVYDDRPFFHYFLKLKNIGEIYRTMGGKWQFFLEEGYLLPAVFVQVAMISLFLVLLPALAGKNGARRRDPLRHSAQEMAPHAFLPYFALLGLGFMFVEIALIQKTILPLENPSYAVAAVLASLLISSGAGSLLSYRFSRLNAPLVPLAISCLIIAYSVLLPAANAFIAPHGLPVKIMLLFLLLMPLGLFMGIPFPIGLKLLGERNASLIPWAWVINGCLSVLAPLLTIMAAIGIGFRWVLLLGALAYFLAFFMLRRFVR